MEIFQDLEKITFVQFQIVENELKKIKNDVEKLSLRIDSLNYDLMVNKINNKEEKR